MSPQAGMMPGMNQMMMQGTQGFPQSPANTNRSFPSSSKVTIRPALNDRKREGEKKVLESWEDVFANSLDNLNLGHNPSDMGRKRSTNTKGWKIGDVAVRKGQMCTIIKIDETT